MKRFTILLLSLLGFSTLASAQSSCQANFSSFDSAACIVYFFDQSTNNTGMPFNYTWDFGDGNTLNTTSSFVTHQYASPGTYPVFFYAYNGLCGDTTTLMVTVNSCTASGPPQANFSYSANLCTVGFQSQASGTPPFSYFWDFGDGNISTAANPIHTYGSPGSYMACFVVSDANGTDSTCQIINITSCTAANCQASFTYLDSAQCTVFFNGQSTGINSPSYFWDFGDGNTGSGQFPIHTYANAGSYTVALLVNGTNCTDTVLQNIIVNTCNAIPQAAFTYSANLCTIGFQNQTTTSGSTQYLWDFGDGNTSTMANPIHTYASPGTYTVCLTAFNANGADSTCQVVSINACTSAPTCTASFTAFDSAACVVYFFDESTNNSGMPFNYYWNFGDGNSSNNASGFVTHQYANAGTYTVQLTVWNSVCADTIWIPVTVNSCATSGGPQADFLYTYSGCTVAFADQSTGAVSYFWDFGDGNTSTVANPSHVYASSGTYTICLLVSDAIGNMDTMCQMLTVNCGGTTNPSFCDSLANCSIGSLGDVDISNVTMGDGLVWDGTQFVAGTVGTGTSSMMAPIHTTGSTDADYVGIGSASPSAKLYVSDMNLGTDAGFAIEAADDNSPNGYSLYIQGHPTNNGNASNHTQITTGDANTRLTLKCASVTDRAPRLQFTGPGESSNPGWAILDYGSRENNLPNASFRARYMPTTGPSITMIEANGMNGVYLAPTAGNVGVGTNSPQEQLHVAGTIRSDDLAGGGAVCADADGNLYVSGACGSSIRSGNDERIEALENELAEIKGLLQELGLMEGGSLTPAVQEASYLMQNRPNPAKGQTDLPYFLVPNTQNAQIVVHSPEGGQVVASFKLEGTGFGRVNWDTSDLAAGVYTYSLVVNGERKDSRKMVLVK